MAAKQIEDIGILLCSKQLNYFTRKQNCMKLQGGNKKNKPSAMVKKRGKHVWKQDIVETHSG